MHRLEQPRKGPSDIPASFILLEALSHAEHAAAQKIDVIFKDGGQGTPAYTIAADVSKSATDDFCAEANRIRAMQSNSLEDIAMQFICLASVQDLEPDIRELIVRFANFAGIKTLIPFGEDFLRDPHAAS